MVEIYLKVLFFVLDWKSIWFVVYCINQIVCIIGILNLVRYIFEYVVFIFEVFVVGEGRSFCLSVSVTGEVVFLDFYINNDMFILYLFVFQEFFFFIVNLEKVILMIIFIQCFIMCQKFINVF